MRIAFDAMGGDHAPTAVIDGVLQAAKSWPDTEIVLVGKDEVVTPVLERAAMDHLSIRTATEVINAEDEPVRAIRRKKDSSMVVGCEMVKEGAADAFISAGNTGVLMAAGLFSTGRIPGIDRPALAPSFPTVTGGKVLVLDVGANPEARPEHLQQYALMGSVYVESGWGIARPRVGLLNIGTEENKGTSLQKEAFGLIKELPINFVGNVEARDVLEGVCDVLVCDGFSGNILLKNTEGVANAVFVKLKEEFTRNPLNKLAAAILKPSLKRFASSMDYKEYGGAPLLGLGGAIIKAHGSSDARAIYNAVRQARLFIERGVIRRISEDLERS
ncbi:phosphate:acyl-[acyl carrier protein] acyltransferase [Marininema mesophilum]|uniref:Phosphate acyltransferase n=1 Tax=Marininema mesophilum TaxID=1048340 RepID=A0A1H2Q2D2_9BACL|nr:phosphate acyltransferase PlsX [Marininema mesophilum]SDW01307.1 phosphate:acyl-[acyl carrier protein] acyltransferase [Marininema mesophilum]